MLLTAVMLASNGVFTQGLLDDYLWLPQLPFSTYHNHLD